MEQSEKCPLRATVIVRNGKGWRGVPDVQCLRRAGHENEIDPEHEFYTHDAHTFGASWEKGRWVSR